jgi:hypothetical protein
MPSIRPVVRYGKSSVRQRHSYRAARREEQKARYRLMKKDRFHR